MSTFPTLGLQACVAYAIFYVCVVRSLIQGSFIVSYYTVEESSEISHKLFLMDPKDDPQAIDKPLSMTFRARTLARLCVIPTFTC